MKQSAKIKNGSVSAAILAAGIASLVLGIVTTLAEAVPDLKLASTIVPEIGPLSGKIAGMIVVWLVAWLGLHFVLKDTEQDFAKVLGVSLAFIALGLVGTFPLFYEMFTPK